MKRIAVITIVFICLSAVYAEDKDLGRGIGITTGLEMSLGDVLSYRTAGFQFSLKPGIEWELFHSGFSLAAGWVIPLMPRNTASSIEVTEKYYREVSEKLEMEFSVGNNNAVTLGNPTGAAGYVFGSFGIFGISAEIDIFYCNSSRISFGTFVIAPRYDVEFGEVAIGIQLKCNVNASVSPTICGVEPVICCGYAF